MRQMSIEAQQQTNHTHIDQPPVPWGHPELLPLMQFDPTTHIVVTGGDVEKIVDLPVIPRGRLGHNEKNEIVMGFRPDEIIANILGTPQEERAAYLSKVVDAAVSAAGTLVMIGGLRRSAQQEAILQIGLIENLINNAATPIPDSLKTHVESLRSSFTRAPSDSTRRAQ